MAKILIVDDEPGYREPLCTVLAHEGHDVRAAASSTEGVAMVADFQPDLAIVDWMLRDQHDGVDVVLTLRAMTAHLRFILISGYPTASLDARLRNVPSCQFLAKPFTLTELTAAIQAALKGAPPEG